MSTDYRDLIIKALGNIKSEAVLIRIYKFVLRLWRSDTSQNG